MTSLIALISSGKGTWSQVNTIILEGKWEKIFLICSEFAYENYTSTLTNVIKLKLNEKNPEESFKKLSLVLKKQINDFEVAVNLDSGTGIEHMILISAILRAGLGLRFVYFHNNELKEFQLLDEKYNFEEEL